MADPRRSSRASKKKLRNETTIVPTNNSNNFINYSTLSVPIPSINNSPPNVSTNSSINKIISILINQSIDDSTVISTNNSTTEITSSLPIQSINNSPALSTNNSISELISILINESNNNSPPDVSTNHSANEPNTKSNPATKSIKNLSKITGIIQTQKHWENTCYGGEHKNEIIYCQTNQTNEDYVICVKPLNGCVLINGIDNYLSDIRMVNAGDYLKNLVNNNQRKSVFIRDTTMKDKKWRRKTRATIYFEQIGLIHSTNYHHLLTLEEFMKMRKWRLRKIDRIQLYAWRKNNDEGIINCIHFLNVGIVLKLWCLNYWMINMMQVAKEDNDTFVHRQGNKLCRLIYGKKKCIECGKMYKKLWRCSACSSRGPSVCSKECQRLAWERYHKFECDWPKKIKTFIM